jgi:hypothetical protein
MGKFLTCMRFNPAQSPPIQFVLGVTKQGLKGL